ncbi:putative metallo-hydrolase [Desulfosporosinus acididurans]|uniref:Putative metallo-hydrolase n=2 Tax=Desulfosporosinus acididurans TaxID=476652 RepID=A0A0J1FQT5_9FIRM|nr:putative metallo-hydrolase [Desulfosporosinus acididurans]
MEIKTFITPFLKSNMYIFIEDGHILIIDPYATEELLQKIRKWGGSVDYLLLTHEHYDHISGVNAFKKEFECQVLCSKACAERIIDSRLNYSRHFEAYCIIQNGLKKGEAPKVEPYSCTADDTFSDYQSFDWQGHTIELIETPGHTRGSICILLDKTILLSGDTLLPEVKTETKNYKNGSKDFEETSKPFLKALQPDTLVYPGHGEKFLIKNYQF